MLAGIWGAFQALKLTEKAIVLGCILGILLALFGWGYLNGKFSCQLQHAEHITAQAIDVAERTMGRSEALETVNEKHADLETKHAEPEQIVTREVIRYVQAPKKNCQLDPEYVHLLDRVNQLQLTAQGRLSEADPGSGGAEDLHAARTATDQLLLAFLATVRGKLEDERIIEWWQEWDATRYKQEMQFYLSLPYYAQEPLPAVP